MNQLYEIIKFIFFLLKQSQLTCMLGFTYGEGGGYNFCPSRLANNLVLARVPIIQVYQMDISVTSKTSQIHRLESFPPSSIQDEHLKPSIRLHDDRSPKPSNSSGVMSIHEEQEQSMRQRENDKESKDVMDFTNAWKSESGLGILLIEKISTIINNYFKMLPQMAKRQEQIQILIVYNKGLLEILNKFQDHERKIISKLKAMEELNVKIMKQLCHVKNRPFRTPEIRNEEPLFGRFSLNDLKFQRKEIPTKKIDESYSKKLKELFQKNLLTPNINLLSDIEVKIEELSKKQDSPIEKDHLQNLDDLKQKIKVYNEGLKDITQENMFDLFKIKTAIQEELKDYGLGKQGSDLSKEMKKEQENTMNFVNEVIKLHAGLTKMEEGQILNCLKTGKEIQKKLRRQRVKEQQKFLRTCESVQSQNTQLSKDIQKYKQKISQLQNQLNIMKAQNDYKKMKIKPSTNRSSIMQDSMLFDDDLKLSNKKLVKETHKAMNHDYKKIKEDNEKLQEIVAEYKGKQMSKNIILPKIRQKAQKMQIPLDPTWQQIKIIEFLLARLGEANRQKKSPSAFDRDDELVSPNLDERSYYGFQVNPIHYLKTIPEKSQIDAEAVENRNKELEKENAELKKKNDENKVMIATKNQDLRRVLQEHEKTLKKKNVKINELVKEYERFQSQIKQLRFLNHLLKLKNQLAQKLVQKLIHAIQQIKVEDILPQNYLQIQSLIQKLFKLIEQYRSEIKKQQENHDQKRQINLTIREGQRDEISSRNGGNLNDLSSLSLFPKMREKRESDIYSISSQNYQGNKSKSKSKVKNIKSLTNQYNEQDLDKELSLKKLYSKKFDSQVLDKSQNKSKQKQKEKQTEKQKDKEKSQQKDNKESSKDKKEIQSPKTLKSSLNRKNQSQIIKEESKEQKSRKIDDYSIEQDRNSHNSNSKFKSFKKTSTELGLPKKDEKSGENKLARTEQNQFPIVDKQKNGSVSEDKIGKSESYQNKNSNSNPKEQQPAKEISNFLSFLEANQNDNIDSISQRPKEVSKSEFKDDDKLGHKEKQEKKNKVEMSDSLKGSLNLVSSRKNRMEDANRSIRDDKKTENNAQDQGENIIINVKNSKESLNAKQNDPKLSDSRMNSSKIHNNSDQKHDKSLQGKTKSSNQAINKGNNNNNNNNNGNSNPNNSNSNHLSNLIPNYNSQNNNSDNNFNKNNNTHLNVNNSNSGNNNTDKSPNANANTNSNNKNYKNGNSYSILNKNSLEVQKSGQRQDDQSINMISEPNIRIHNVTHKQDSEESGQQKSRHQIYYQASRSHDRNSELNNVSLNYSKLSQVKPKNNHSYFHDLHLDIPKSKARNYEPQKSMLTERIAQITVEQHEKILARIQKLGNLDDVLDFTQLYNRYKQVLMCLQQAETQNRALQLRYQKFVNEIIKTKQVSPDYSFEEELFYLRDLVHEQRCQIEQFDKKCNEEMKTSIKTSEQLINEHLKMMRKAHRDKKERQSKEKKLFI